MYGRDRAGASRGASCHMASRSNFWSGDGSPRPHPPVPPPPRRHETYVAWRRVLCIGAAMLLVPLPNTSVHPNESREVVQRQQ